MDDFTIIATTTEHVLNADIEAKAGRYRFLIPEGAPHALAQQIAHAVVDALAKAHAGKT